MRSVTLALLLTALLLAPARGPAQTRQSDAKGKVTPAQYLASRPHPAFKAGNTLLPLTRWGWLLSYETQVEVVRWGYALDFGDATPTNIAKLGNPTSIELKLVSLVRKDPSRYKLSVLMPAFQRGKMPNEAYLHDADGNLQKPLRWSPGSSKLIDGRLSDESD